MRQHLILALLGILLTVGSAHASNVAATSVSRLTAAETSCAPGRLDDALSPDGCGVLAEDDATLGAELLVGRLGAGAPDYAGKLAERYAAERDDASAALWRRIATVATGLVAQH